MAGTTSGVLFESNGSDIDMTLYQGKTVNFTLTWGGSSPINITGYTARMQLRESFNATAKIAEFTTENGRISVGGANGIFTFSMTATDTAALPAVSGVYDIEIINGSSVYLAQSGKFMIAPEVTK